jgi:predicted nucleic acid-binding protein
MATTLADLAVPPEHVMLDTNVLLAATDEGRQTHRAALEVIGKWPGKGTTLYISGQILREYLAVATRPIEQNGLGMRPADAVSNVRALRDRATLLAENVPVADRLLALMRDVASRGKQVHDANVVATMLAHSVSTVVTANATDFTRYAQFIGVVTFGPVDGSPR